jgi:hypothetical protein
MEPSKFVIGPLPMPQRSRHILERIEQAVIDFLAVLGWMIAMTIMLAALSPTISGHLEHYVWSVIIAGQDE